jgi:hypothetical protein
MAEVEEFGKSSNFEAENKPNTNFIICVYFLFHLTFHSATLYRLMFALRWNVLFF